MKTLRSLLYIGAGILVSAITVHATPYASGVTNASGTIKFILNEPADDVYVVFENGTTNDLGVQTNTGTMSFDLGTNESYSIYVTKVGSGTASQISSDTNILNMYNSPRGVAVNTDPKSSVFGRIYVANSTPGGTHSTTRGIYLLNADQSDAVGQGNAALATSVFTSASSSSPFRIAVASNDTVYVGDYSTANANLWAFDPSFDTFTNQIFAIIGETPGIAAGIHGDIEGEHVTGTLADGNLVVWTADSGLPSNATNSLGFNTAPGDYENIYRYTIGSGPLPATGWSNAPDLAVTLGLSSYQDLAQIDMDVAPNGYIFGSFARLSGSPPCLQVFSADGTQLLFNSLENGATTDPLIQSVSVKVSPDDKFVACLYYYNDIYLLSLTNGVPDLTTLTVISNMPEFNTARQIGWDAADNLYTVSSGQGLLRVFSLGETTTAVTHNDASGTNGTFDLITPNVTATVTATIPLASQAGGSYGNYATAQAGQFTISLNAPQTVAVPITFTLGGTATNGMYTASAPTVVTFAPGQTNATVTITPTATPVSGPTTTVTLSLKSGASYSAASPQVATVTIANTGPQVLSITRISDPTMYRGNAQDYAGFVISRYGDTNAAYTIPASVFTYSGTAVEGTDYTGTIPAIPVAAGDGAEMAEVSDPVSTPFPFTYKGNESIIVTLASGTSVEGTAFTVASNTAALTLIDNAYPSENILWSDELTNASDSVNWTVAFASEKSPTVIIPDYPNDSGGSDATNDFDVEFGYALAGDAQGAANPPNGSPTALKVTVNKNGTGASAGVSIYPSGRLFAGNYAFRFSVLPMEDSGSFATEYTDWGINHYGTNANWWAGDFTTGEDGTSNIDGVWYSASSDQGGASFGDIPEFTGQPLPNDGWLNPATAEWSSYTNVFKHPPYNSTGNGSYAEGGGNGTGTIWSDVEVKQYQGVITMSINKTVIFTYTNTTIFTNGDVMLGYTDPFSSVGTYGVSYFSDARVVGLGPAIFNQPTNLTVNLGAPASFTVGAESPGTITYQYYLNGMPVTNSDNISGAQANTLDIASAGATNVGNYTVVVTDSSGSITSSVVTLTEITPPAITTGPVSVTNNVGTTVKFTVTASGSASTYTWTTNGVALVNGGQISGATTSTLTIANITLANAGAYFVTVSNSAGTASASATLTVIVPPSPTLTGVGLNGGNTVIEFTTGDQYDLTNSFNLQSSTNLAAANEGFTNLSTATYTETSGVFTVSVATNGPTRFYRLQHK